MIEWKDLASTSINWRWGANVHFSNGWSALESLMWLILEWQRKWVGPSVKLGAESLERVGEWHRSTKSFERKHWLVSKERGKSREDTLRCSARVKLYKNLHNSESGRLNRTSMDSDSSGLNTINSNVRM